MNDYSQQVESAARVISARWPAQPSYGIILGTGAGEIADRIKPESQIPYGDLPSFPQSTALGHTGQFVCGRLCGQPIIAMQGRFHLYEGYAARQIELPIEVMHSLGVQVLFISNAAGGLNPIYASGQLMLIDSHLDLMFRSSLPGEAVSWNDRVKRGADFYDHRLMDQAMIDARNGDFALHRGVYAGLLGPNYETRAEYRFLRRMGADVVGMSTVPEVVVAARLGMRVLACSIVANVAKPDVLAPTSGQEVIDAASVAAPHLYWIVKNAIERTAL